MLRSLKAMRGSALEALDGRLGRVLDFYFDDRSWTVRYLVADTSRWLAGRRVLISPVALGEPDWAQGGIPVRLSKEQVRSAPSESSVETVSRRHELELARYYAWPTYWALTPAPPHHRPDSPAALAGSGEAEGDEIHLRSVERVLGYRVRSGDEDAGVVEDLTAETGSWKVRYLVVDARPWWPGGRVLLSPDWIERIDWASATFHTRLSREEVRSSPPAPSADTIERGYEEQLYEHFGRPKYWE